MKPRLVRPTRQVPGVNVFFHASAQAGLIFGGQARAGVGYTVLEAILVDLLNQEFGILDVALENNGRLDLLSNCAGRRRGLEWGR